ncbi:hypothetical protein, partial [Mycobacterium nebraskense]|uniref:hypothetical protein n=1 Tax=Mycobacterium nebraskense TaxID=244292 RepID=UPI001E3E63FE
FRKSHRNRHGANRICQRHRIGSSTQASGTYVRPLLHRSWDATALWTLRSKSHDLHLDDLVVLPHFYGTEMILCAGDYRGIW